jgi:hypothetical protein
MSYAMAALGLVVVAQGAALFVLLRARRGGSRRDEARAVAHDLNNALAVILNYASFVQDGLAMGDPRRDDAAEIRRAARQAGGLSQELVVLTGAAKASSDRPAP